jgi:hypothetical protein
MVNNLRVGDIIFLPTGEYSFNHKPGNLSFKGGPALIEDVRDQDMTTRPLDIDREWSEKEPLLHVYLTAELLSRISVTGRMRQFWIRTEVGND